MTKGAIASAMIIQRYAQAVQMTMLGSDGGQLLAFLPPPLVLATETRGAT